MFATDVREFNSVLERCAQVFGPKELPNDLKTSYWDALKDIPLQQVKELATAHMKRGKFFPKPTELRPKDDRKDTRTAAMDAQFQEGEKRAIGNLEFLKRENPARYLLDVQLGYLDRTLATQPPDSPIHAQALEESRRIRALVRGY